MCGIAGLLSVDPLTSGDLEALRSMTDALAHRGPDDAGVWADEAAGVGLGNRRLAIIDLTESGHQPMSCACRRWTVTYNGEIYRHNALATRLNRPLRGHSDTEVLVEALCAWGITRTLEAIDGMFAFGAWDSTARQLHLVRDRTGIKPLFVAHYRGGIAFASELKGLHPLPGFSPSLDPSAVDLYLRFDYVPAPHSIYRQVQKVAPGSLITLRPGDRTWRAEEYWSVLDVAEDRRESGRSESALVDRLDDLLRDSIRSQLVADVPVGAFLSGGVDSATVVAIMQSQLDRPVRTFSVGSRQPGFDEPRGAAPVARAIGAHHTELYVAEAEARATIPRLATIYDEPFAEPSQIPMTLLAERARQDVTVVLTGDGADELLGGYDWYRSAGWRRRILDSPLPWRVLTPLIERMTMRSVLPGRLGKMLRHDSERLSAVLQADSVLARSLALRSTWARTGSLLTESPSPARLLQPPASAHEVEQLMLFDLLRFLPEHPLAKTDRATMAVGLEARIPMLDRSLVEFSWTLPLELRVGRAGKEALRALAKRYLPPDVSRRPKVGFGAPVGDWLRGDLRGWAEDLLDPTRLRRQGLLRSDVVSRAWREHLEGLDRGRRLWNLLMFQSWLDTWHPNLS